MTIPSSFIDQILDQSDIVDIVGQRVQLNKKGSNHWGLCPFHDDTNPSMAVNQDKQFYYCFVCNAKGNSINFLREYENLDFVEFSPDPNTWLNENKNIKKKFNL